MCVLEYKPPSVIPHRQAFTGTLKSLHSPNFHAQLVIVCGQINNKLINVTFGTKLFFLYCVSPSYQVKYTTNVVIVAML